MMILSSPASSTRRNAGKEDVKVLEPSPEGYQQAAQAPQSMAFSTTCSGTAEIGVELFGVFRFTYEGLPLEKSLWGQELRKGSLHGTC